MGDFLNFLLQLIQVGALLGRDGHTEDIATERLRGQSVGGQVEHHGLNISLRPIDLIDCHDEWNVGSLGKLNHFNGLLLDALYS